MLPSSKQSLRAARRLLREAQLEVAPATSSKLVMVDAMLNDLSMGVESSFYRQHVERGRTLLREGASFLAKGAVSAHDEAIAELASRPLSEECQLDEAQRFVLDLSREMIRIIEALYASTASASHLRNRTAYYERVAAWEQDLYGRRAEFGSSVPSPLVSRQLKAADVATYLKTTSTGLPELQILSCKQLTGGFNRSTWLIEAQDAENRRCDFVIRGEQPVSATPITGFDITTEFGVLRMAHRAGVRVPEPLWIEPDAKRLGMRFLASRRATGANIGTFAGPDQPLSQKLLKNLVNQLVAIHRVEVTRDRELLNTTHLKEWARCRTITEAITYWLENWHAVWKGGPTYSPIVARAFAWLLSNVPVCEEPPALLHSDFALGNILVENDEVSAVLDWEATHLGDPAEEVSWLMSNLRSVVDRDDLYRVYLAAGGKPIDEFRLRFFDVFAAAKLLMCGIYAFRQFEQHDQANPNLHWLSVLIMAQPAKAIDEVIEKAESAKGR